MAPGLSLRQQVGQCLIMGFGGLEVTSRLRNLLAELQPGGVILFQRNLAEPDQIWTLLRQCRQAVSVPLFTCIDMEGGLVDRLREVVAPAPSAESIAATGKPGLFYRHGWLIGREVRALGFNVDFAPVLDLARPASRAILRSRTASAGPEEAVLYARHFLRGLRKAGVLGCGKHFPGLGDGDLDSHLELPTIHKPWKDLWASDLYPYRKLRREMPFVMVAHACYPKAVKELRSPASLSRRWVTDILRRRIGYRGFVVSDDLEMGAAQATVSVEQAAVAALRAGADLFLVCHSEERVVGAFEAVLREAEGDRRFARQVHEAASRLLQFKRRAGAMKPGSSPPTRGLLERLRREFQSLEERRSIAGDKSC